MAKRSRKKAFQDTIKYLRQDEWKKLRDCIDNSRDSLIIRLLYDTGCRVGEVTLMEIKHIDFENNFIRIPSTNTKTGQPRTVRVSKSVMKALKKYLDGEDRADGRVLCARNRDSITTRRIEQIIQTYAGKSGIQDVYDYDSKGRALHRITPHTLRHTHVVHALMKRVPITAVQKQVGHKRLTTTQIYSNLAPEQVKEAYEEAGFE